MKPRFQRFTSLRDRVRFWHPKTLLLKWVSRKRNSPSLIPEPKLFPRHFHTPNPQPSQLAQFTPSDQRIQIIVILMNFSQQLQTGLVRINITSEPIEALGLFEFLQLPD